MHISVLAAITFILTIFESWDISQIYLLKNYKRRISSFLGISQVPVLIINKPICSFDDESYLGILYKYVNIHIVDSDDVNND